MDFQIFTVLDPPEVDRILGGLAQINFVEGKTTAQGLAQAVKNNLQTELSSPAHQQLAESVRSALFKSSAFQAFALPRRVMLPMFSRYVPGMDYGSHMDSAIITTTGDPLRSDLAVTLFLAPPGSYDGGELTLELSHGEEQIKLPAGEAVAYSADTVHRVAPVTRGARMAAVTWVQSAVRDQRMRALLFDLYLAMQQAEKGEPPVLLISKTYNNLLRMTSEI